MQDSVGKRIQCLFIGNSLPLDRRVRFVFSVLLLPLFYFSSLLHRGRQGLGQVRAAWTVAWEGKLWSITCQSQPEPQNSSHGLTNVVTVWLRVDVFLF